MKRSVFVIGDSISIQYGPYLQEELSPDLDYDRKSGTEEALKDLNIPTGANGGDSGMVLAYLQELQSRDSRFDILMINCGLHDVKTDPVTGSKQVTLEQYKANMEQICRLAVSMSKQFIWVRTTPLIDEVHNSRSKSFHRFYEDVLRYNAAADAIMEAHQIQMFDLHGFTLALGPGVYCDHVHFTDEVRRQQAAFLAKELRSIG